MNYRHAYHAGNFADVFKHSIIVALTQSFLQKDSAFCYLDTHSGAGRYNLLSKAAQTNKEFKNGIEKILAQPNPPEFIKDFLYCVQKNPSFYPGSPLFVKEFLRPQDRMILSELHSEEYFLLKKLLGSRKQVSVYCQDAYQSLKAYLPPKERRGFVLIDPPFEKQNEFESLTKALSQAIQRWETGVYAIWYPIKNRAVTERFLNTLHAKINRPLLVAELSIYAEDTVFQLNGCGMAIINPPWQFDKKLNKLIPWLWKTLSVNQQGRFRVI